MTALGPDSKSSTRSCTLMKTTILIGRQILMLKTNRFTHVQGILSPAPLTYWRTREEKTKKIYNIFLYSLLKKLDNYDTNPHFSFYITTNFVNFGVAFQQHTCPCGRDLCITCLHVCSTILYPRKPSHFLAKMPL